MVKKILPMLSLAFILLSCSSLPKQPAAVFTTRNRAAQQLELANKQADRGDFQTALELLLEARRLAVSADDPALRIRTELSRGNILYFLDRREEASQAWDAALREATGLENKELIAACRIYQARAWMLDYSAGSYTDNRNRISELTALRNDVERWIKDIKNDTLSAALGWTTVALAEKALGHWEAAEKALKKALKIHDEDNYLELAAYDWYVIASVWSIAGDYPRALAALEEAIAYDRRSENAQGLAADYQACAVVLNKSGDAAGAEAALKRAEEIQNAISY
jgi:tetratricopeptide (TPR) repeat protein